MQEIIARLAFIFVLSVSAGCQTRPASAPVPIAVQTLARPADAARPLSTTTPLPRACINPATLTQGPIVAFGPALSPEMEKLATGLIRWIDRETFEQTNINSPEANQPYGKFVRLSMEDSFRASYISPAQREKSIDSSMQNALWITRGICMGETRPYYRVIGGITVSDSKEINWDYDLPYPSLDERGNPMPPVGRDSGHYIIRPSSPEYPCFWHQLSHFPSRRSLMFVLPDMLVIENCLISAGLKPHEAFKSTKDTIELSDKEEAIRRARTPTNR